MVVGMIGALVGIGIFCLGFLLGIKMSLPKKVDPAQPTDEELAQIKEERRRLIQDQEAFRELMNYNVDVAYGVTGNNL